MKKTVQKKRIELQRLLLFRQSSEHLFHCHIKSHSDFSICIFSNFVLCIHYFLSKLIKYISPVLRTYMLLALVVGGIQIFHKLPKVFSGTVSEWESSFFRKLCYCV